jgi:hypothetical protein
MTNDEQGFDSVKMNELQKINTLTTKLDEEINQESERESTNHHR